jgi:hypothetical protein
MDHLLDLRNREHVAIDGLLRSLPMACPGWYDSIGLDAFSHWALLRPVLTTARKQEAEVDAILGRMAPIVDAIGTMQPIWPPPTDYLVAVEAKCMPVSWTDTEEWANLKSKKSKLTQQLKRDLVLGFSRVSAMHVIATPSAETFQSAMSASDRLGSHVLLRAERELVDEKGRLRVGHCVLGIGEVAWKSWDHAGAATVLAMEPAPFVGSTSSFVRDQVDAILCNCPRPPYWRTLYACDGKMHWGFLGDLFAPLIKLGSQ